MTPPAVQWLGALDYRWALDLQRGRREAVIRGTAPEVVWTLEHPAVVTLGRRGGDVASMGRDVPVVQVERGGLATAHELGQLVGYLIIDLGARRISVRHAVWAIEEGLIRWLASEGAEASRRDGAPGVWIGDAKIASIGIHVSRGVTMHGFALNLCNTLDAFQGIVPCGLADARITTLARVLGRSPSPELAAAAVGSAVIDTLFDTPTGGE